MNNQILKILIVQTAYPGDVILTTPMVQVLKEKLRQVEISFLAIPRTVELLENNPFVDHIICYDKHGRGKWPWSLWWFSKRLKKMDFDLALLPHRSWRSALLTFFARIPLRVGFDRSPAAILYTQRIPYLTQRHEVERNLALLSVLGISAAKPVPPQIFPTEEDKAQVDQFFQQHQLGDVKGAVALAPGSVWPTKRWFSDRFAALAKQLAENGHPIVLIGGPGDQEIGKEIETECKGQVINLIGYLNLRQSAETIRRCRALVSNDSAPAHLGAAVGTPVVAIFGPTVPAFGFYPYGEGHRVIERTLPCRPCSSHGGKKCPTQTFECMTEITVDEVYQAVQDVLGKCEGVKR